MNDLAPVNVALTEPEVEGTVLGSLISNPDALLAMAGEIDVEWFTDPAARVFIEATLKLHRDGHRVSAAALIAGVSPAVERDGLTRAKFLTQVSYLALPLRMLSGPVAVLRNRWARRVLARTADELAHDARALDADPFDVAASTVGALDTVSMSRGERADGSLAECADQLLKALGEPASLTGPTTGLLRLDDKLNGYVPGKLYVLAGRPGMGKSALACSSLRRTAAAGNGVALFSLEMGKEEIAARCMADTIGRETGPTFGSILRGYLREEDMDPLADARLTFDALPLHIDAAPRLTITEIAARARKVKARYEAGGLRLAVVAIDHIGLIEPSNRYAGNKTAEAGEISRASKILAKELDCCVVLLSQLSRAVEGRDDKRPTLADLRWSGEIEQDADVVAFLYRPEYYVAQDPNCDPGALLEATNRLDVLIRKNRNGECGDVPLWCSIAHSAIRDYRP